MGASYTSTVLRNHPVSVLKLQIILIESVRDGVTKRKLADDFILRDLNFTVSQTEDQSSRVCSPCSNKVRSTWAEFCITKTSFQESEHDDDSFRKNVHITSCFRGR